MGQLFRPGLGAAGLRGQAGARLDGPRVGRGLEPPGGGLGPRRPLREHHGRSPHLLGRVGQEAVLRHCHLAERGKYLLNIDKRRRKADDLFIIYSNTR